MPTNAHGPRICFSTAGGAFQITLGELSTSSDRLLAGKPAMTRVEVPTPKHARAHRGSAPHAERRKRRARVQAPAPEQARAQDGSGACVSKSWRCARLEAPVPEQAHAHDGGGACARQSWRRARLEAPVPEHARAGQ